MKHRKLYIGIISVLLIIITSVGGVFYYMNVTSNQNIVTIDEYATKVDGIINNVRSGQQKWTDLLGGSSYGSEVTFQDLCTGYYSTQFRNLGTYFLEQVSTFENLRLENDEQPAISIPNYDIYQDYFTTYKTIGERLISFADKVDAGNYQDAVNDLETLIGLYDTLPILY